MQDPVTSLEEPPAAPEPAVATTEGRAQEVAAALRGLEQELERLFPAASPQRDCLVPSLAAVRAAPPGPELAAALDELEDLVEALLRASGWPGGIGRGGPG